MARSLTPRDCHALINLVAKEALGVDATIQAIDSSTFVSVGETILNSGIENTLNALSIVLGRTFMAVRPYNGKFKIIEEMSSDLYSQRIRKISFYARESLSAGDWNTQLNGANLKQGSENTAAGTLDAGSSSATGSMWQQNQPKALELNFGGQSVWEDSTTVYEDQLKVAFTDESSFASFVGGIMTEKGNDIESQKEAFNRMTFLNHMAGVYDMSASMPNSVVNLTSAYNSRFGTSYTTAELLSTYLESFLKFFVSEVKIISDRMTNRGLNYHWNPSATEKLMRHTPKEKQKLVLYNPLFIEAQSWVYPSLFNPEYLNIDNAEFVDFFQNVNDPMAIKVTPAIPDTSDPTEQKAGSQVALSYVVGMLFDADACMIHHQLERSASTPLEARKNYRNIWWSFSKNAINDFTENAVLFYMADPTP